MPNLTAFCHDNDFASASPPEWDNHEGGFCKGRRRIGRKEANMAGDNKTFDGDNTRQGVTGHHVRHVLAFGVAAVVLAFILVAVVT